MKLIFLVAILLSVSIKPSFFQHYQEQKEITSKVIEHFEANEIAAIYELFDITMKEATSEEKLTDIWNSLPLQCGAYLGNGESVASEVQGMIVVNQLLDFETIDLDIRLAFNSENQISGLFFVPPVKKN